MKLKTLILAITLLISINLNSQTEDPKIGLVLAGGGAWGFAHVGALRVLEENKIPISYVSGTSIGSIIGSLYAMGWSVDELEELIFSTNWLSILNDSIDRKDIIASNKDSYQRYLLGFSVRDKSIDLPGGIVEGQKVKSLLNSLHWDAIYIDDFSKLPKPFACVATDITTGDPVILNKGSLTDSVRASISIPGVFAPVIIDDRILVDGMFSMNLPVQAVKDMGAEKVIAVNFDIPDTGITDYTTLTGSVYQAFVMNVNRSIKEQLPLADYVISPQVNGYSTFQYDRAREIYNLGLEAARREVKKLKPLSNSELYKKQSMKKLKPIEKISIHRVEITGVDENIESKIRNIIPLNIKTVTQEEIESIVYRIYSLGYFNLVNYKVIQDTLYIDIKKKKNSILQVASYFDTTDNVSLLLNLKTHQTKDIDLYSDFSIRLGEKKEIMDELTINLGYRNLLSVFGKVRFTQDIYYKDESYNFNGAMGIGLIPTKYIYTTAGLSYDLFTKEETSYTFLLNTKLLIDTLNRTEFPDSGLYFKLGYDWAFPTEISSDYGRGELRTLFNYSIIPDLLSISAGLDHGSILADDTFREFLNIDSSYSIPLNYKVYSGGFSTVDNSLEFLGYEKRAISYNHSSIFRIGLQLEPVDDLFFHLKYNGGIFADNYEEETTYLWGIGISSGYLTPIGPIKLGVSGYDSGFNFELSMGYQM